MIKNLFPYLTAGLRRSAAICLVAAASASFTGCIDDKYDLDDIDSNVRLKVENLTLPIKLDAIELKSIIADPKEGDILQIVDGEYALIRTGDFKSKELKIDKISIQAPPTNPSIAIFRPSIPGGAPAKAAPTEVKFLIEDKEASPMHYTYDDVSEDIVEIGSLGATWTITYNVEIQAVGNSTSSFTLSHLEFQLPGGLNGTPSIGEYNPGTGIISVKDYEVVNNKITFVMPVTGINAKKAGVHFDPDTHFLELDASTGVIDGEIIVKIADIGSGIPTELRVSTALELSDIEIKTFSGKIKYDIDAFTIAPIKLNDLPDVISQKGTDLRLANPQIYLDLDNPFGQYGVHAYTGFQIEPDDREPVKINDNNTFEILGTPKSYYCLSPVKPEKYYGDYAKVEYVNYEPFASLGNVVAGDGLPKELTINLNPTVVPVQPVKDFRLGDYEPVGGNYVFFSPLALGAGAKIEYSSTEDGWSDDDLNKLTITELRVKTDVTNDLPFNVNLTAKPLNTSGPIPNVTITPVTVEGGKTQTIEIVVNTNPKEGYVIKNLDGIEFTATVSSDANTSSLKPSQTIKLNNNRITVSGYYDDEL